MDTFFGPPRDSEIKIEGDSYGIIVTGPAYSFPGGKEGSTFLPILKSIFNPDVL